MPELPEVETVARQLAGLIPGRKVRRLTILDPKLTLRSRPGLVGQRIDRVFRVGKQVLIETSRPRWLCIHLRMTGRLIWYPSRELPEQQAHLRARLVLDGGQVWFVDPRRFGTLSVHGDLAETAPKGVEPLSDELTARRLRALLGSSGQQLKVWLLRQDRVVGLGNIYACEILFAARLDPFRAAGSLSADQVRRLHRSIRRVLRQAIDCCGTTFSDFQDARGVYGGFQEFLQVYAREGQPCRVCGAPIERVEQQQRGTFYCPTCQR